MVRRCRRSHRPGGLRPRHHRCRPVTREAARTSSRAVRRGCRGPRDRPGSPPGATACPGPRRRLCRLRGPARRSDRGVRSTHRRSGPRRPGPAYGPAGRRSAQRAGRSRPYVVRWRAQHGRGSSSSGARIRAASAGGQSRSTRSSTECRSMRQSRASLPASSGTNPAAKSRPRRHPTTAPSSERVSYEVVSEVIAVLATAAAWALPRHVALSVHACRPPSRPPWWRGSSMSRYGFGSSWLSPRDAAMLWSWTRTEPSRLSSTADQALPSPNSSITSVGQRRRRRESKQPRSVPSFAGSTTALTAARHATRRCCSPRRMAG
jgi:hypothetical protein